MAKSHLAVAGRIIVPSSPVNRLDELTEQVANSATAIPAQALVLPANAPLDDPSSPGRNREKRCSRCGNKLICGPSDREAGCWCEGFPHVLPFTGEDCMCRDCVVLEVERLEKIHSNKETK